MIDLMKDKAHRKEFCRHMDSLFRCRPSQINPEMENCEIDCPFKAAVDVQRWCNEEGVSIRVALERWAVKTIDDKMKFTVLADGLGVSVEDLKALVKVIKVHHDRKRNR